MLDNTELKMPLTSHDVTAERIMQLHELFPDAFTEGVLDTEKLKQLIGEVPPAGPERYGLSWAGKAEALRAVQNLSTATLRPAPDQSVDFETTGNLIIEGDNLEVLKLLQKSYHRSIKMIYIDPPYNTGNDFIYPDNFREGLQTYLEYTGQVKDGVRQNTNTETNGRYHSNWLSMMYPRLFLARNLLREDGVIFVSIDDHEVHNLRLLMNDVFGEENFVGQLVVQSNPRGSQSIKHLANVHEYVLFYAKEQLKLDDIGINLDDAMKAEYRYTSEDGRNYRLLGLRLRGGAWRRHQRPLLHFPIYIDPASGKVSLERSERFNIEVKPIKPTTGEDGTWRWSKKKVHDEAHLLVGRKVDREGEGEAWDVFQIDFMEKDGGEERKTKAKTIWDEKELNYQNGTTELKSLFNGIDVFSFPKPKQLVKRLVHMADCEEGDIILDFFAGSGSTAQATMELNTEDGSNRKFILVQLPEILDPEEQAAAYAFCASIHKPTNIAEITKERVRRAAKKLSDDQNGRLPAPDAKPQDRGFKVFMLDGSNFKVWDANAANGDGDKLAEQLQLYTEHRLPDRSPHDVLYELLLKAGRPLTAPIVERNIVGQTVYDVDGGQLLVCLEDPISENTLHGMIELKPERVLCLDSAFEGNDQLKTNIVLQMRDSEIEFRTV